MESSEWSDKLDMVVCWTSLFPAIKQLLGLQREGLDPPQTIPIHSQACGSPAPQRDRG